jgi:hypothetical protein
MRRSKKYVKKYQPEILFLGGKIIRPEPLYLVYINNINIAECLTYADGLEIIKQLKEIEIRNATNLEIVI